MPKRSLRQKKRGGRVGRGNMRKGREYVTGLRKVQK